MERTAGKESCKIKTMRHGSRSKFKEEMNYGSTAQYDRNECEQNVRRYNKRTGKIFREIIFWLQNQPCR